MNDVIETQGPKDEKSYIELANKAVDDVFKKHDESRFVIDGSSRDDRQLLVNNGVEYKDNVSGLDPQTVVTPTNATELTGAAILTAAEQKGRGDIIAKKDYLGAEIGDPAGVDVTTSVTPQALDAESKVEKPTLDLDANIEGHYS